jgi:acyl-CoA synthetase (AMP-forming)/AMP-acid ligase II
VEEGLKTHPQVVDALVFGLPDERFGQSIAAIVSLEPGASAAPEDLISHIRARLSHYKAPRKLHIVAQVPRAPNGKPDYPAAKEMFAAAQA